MKDFAQFTNKKLTTAIRRHLLVLAVAGSAMTALPAVAQEEGLVLEEVIVTATKRETSLMDTGISISAFFIVSSSAFLFLY